MIGKKISHYQILDKLGQGGMGVVYKAEDSKLKRQVAIKFLPREIAGRADERKRFKIEAQAAAALNHPNIATIHAIEDVNDEVFIVMEYIDGEELHEKIQAGPLPVTEALDIAEQIARGLQVAHAQEVIHRDIKSTNIMLTRDGQIKVMDFGLAKIRGSSVLTKVGTTLGTAAYMSPEQTRGEKVDHRADIWSFGVVLYEMLSGQLPFKGDYEQAIIFSILNEEPAPLKDIPVDVEQLVLTLLSKNPDQRYGRIEDFLQELRGIRSKKVKSESEESEKAIAVLPLENPSQDSEIDYLADGLTEEVIVNLSGLKSMRVVPRTTSMQYKGSKKDAKRIGKELGVRYIIAGSVRKFQDNLRISAQLIDVDSDRQLWAKTYKGKLADAFDIQEEVSKQIVDATEAFDCYLRAREFLARRTKNSVHIAIQLFEKAIQLDESYAAAYAGLGEAYGVVYRDFDRDEAWLDKSLQVGQNAVKYDPTSSEAYAALAIARFGKNALREALEASQKAIELDPNNYNAYWILARIYHTTDRDQEAVNALEKAVDVKPDFLQAYADLEMFYERLGDQKKLEEIVNKTLEVYPRYLSQHPEDSYRRMSYAVTLAKEARIEEARTEGVKALELSPKDPIMMYYGACLYARMGEKKEAVKLIRDAVDNGYENYEWIKRDPDFDNIRDEPGYIELMKGK